MAEFSAIDVQIKNKLGLHARAATLFVQLASKFPCEVFVEKDGQRVNGKSIMGVLMLVASIGTMIRIIAEGERSKDAVAALKELVDAKFNEAE